MATIGKFIENSMIKNISDDERVRLDNLAIFANNFKQMLETCGRAVFNAIERIENDHRRQGLLKIYRTRHSWRKADVVRLENYQLNQSALNRLKKLRTSKRRGRGLTANNIPLSNRLISVGKFLVEMYDPTTLPNQRLRMLKQTTWCAEFVEMTYRGEYLKMKKSGVVAASLRAEEAVAAAFCISVSYVKQFRSAVRKNAVAEFSKNPPIEVKDFENWKKHGEFS